MNCTICLEGIKNTIYSLIWNCFILGDDTKKILFLFNVGGDAENTFLKMNEDLYTAAFNY